MDESPLDVRVDILGPCRKRVAVTLPPERVREEFDRQYREINDSLVYPGFRKGHAPRRLLEKRFGASLGREVKEKLVQGAIEKLIQEKQVDPLEPPQVDLEPLAVQPEAAFAFEFEVVTKPEFATPSYADIEVELPAVSVSDEDVARAVDLLRRREARLGTVEGATASDDDILVVDWEARAGDSVEAHDENAYYPFGRGVLASFVAPGLDEALRGSAPGTRASVPVRVAVDDPREELRGKELDLQVTVKEVKRYMLPALDEAFLKRHDYDDEEEMRVELRKQIGRAQARERDGVLEDRIVEQLVGGVEISLPPEFVEKQLTSWARRKRVQLEIEGIDEQEIAKRIEQERGDAKTAVEQELRRFFLLDRIADAEDVRVAEKDLVQAIEEIARVYGRPETEVLASFREGGRLAELSAQIRHRKTRELLRGKAKVREIPAPEATKSAAQGEK